MRRVLLVISWVLSACFNPDDILPVHGSLTSADPVAGQVVRLLRDPAGAREANCAEAQPFKEATADEAGNFSFDVFRAQAVKLTAQGVFCFRVETTFASGTTVFTDLVGLSSEVTLPPFPDWRAAPSRVDGVLRFEPFAPLPVEERFEGDQVVHRAEWITADGGLAWVVDDRVMALNPVTNEVAPARVPMAFDDFALEDFSGSVAINARFTITEEDGPFGSNSTTLEARSGQTLQVAGARAPFSRGLECPVFGTPCYLTDGDLSAVDAGNTNGLIFAFAAPTSVSAVVLRGVETEASLMALQLTDEDGGTVLVQQVLPTSLWSGAVPNFTLRPLPDGGLEFGPKADARFVTIRVDAGVLVEQVQFGFVSPVARAGEISVFE
ncbi:MAG: hypothetical protein Q8N23_11885 [Archangium sp.]|nr:hypothetical protein [Archangium sp.]MDP3573475.1 hypothetical protein [Archangium sp.]